MMVTTGASRGIRALPYALAGVAAAGAGLFLWSRRARDPGEESLLEEVEAHPS
jgi:hypothetical protein